MKEQARIKIAELVARFDEQKSSYTNAAYNETQTRRDFIDPFFKALGWDVDNEAGYAEAYRDVINEDRVKVGRATKAPDYSFRVGGKRLFFLEAKKPNVSIKNEPSAAYQVRRYGWSAHLNVSIITDFEEFAVYDCTKKPLIGDKASVARIDYFTYDQYLERFDYIWATFSKECVLQGGLDKFVSNTKNKRGMSTVDADFLASLDAWRELLAKSIAKNNNISADELNHVVQLTIDRIIFLRIAEDRSVERYGQLKEELKSVSYYKNLLHVFRIADEKYNSGLFDFATDKISPKINIDNKTIARIVGELYYPDCPYEFSVLPVEILGSAYEQFLGKIIRLTPSGNAKIEEKPEVRKAGGVYYTPQYIVDYIVANTVGKLVEGKTPTQVAKLKICDPACGSGSFLIGAYQFLLDWHLNYYKNNLRKNDVGKRLKNSTLTPNGGLTTAEKKRILLNNIYGVDIDGNAVEVTKLSLLLKCMEGETEASINQQLTLFHDRVLPSLKNNIKCGNSLIDFDYSEQNSFYENAESIKKINPFSWRDEFPSVFKVESEVETIEDLEKLAHKTKQSAKKTLNYAERLEAEIVRHKENTIIREPSSVYNTKIVQRGGFDCVIGNPPYVDSEEMTKSNIELRSYALSRYETAKGNWDMYCIYTEQAIKLLKYGGKFGFIIPNKFLSVPYGNYLKNYLSQYQIEHIEDFSSINVFVSNHKKINVYPIILIVDKNNNNSVGEYSKYTKSKDKILVECSKEFEIKNGDIDWTTKFSFGSSLIDKIIAKSSKINEYYIVENAATVNEAYLIKYILEDKKQSNGKIKFINTGTIDRYSNNWGVEYTQYIKDKYLYPIMDIKELKKIIPNRMQHICSNKIVVAGMVKKLEATIVDNTFYSGKSTVIIISKTKSEIDLKYLLGLLNSKLYNYVYIEQNKHNAMSGGYMNVSAKQLSNFIYFHITNKNKQEQSIANDISKRVELLLQLNKDLQNATLPEQTEQIQRLIKYNDNRINADIYALYGLTDDEIKIIENANSKK